MLPWPDKPPSHYSDSPTRFKVVLAILSGILFPPLGLVFGYFDMGYFEKGTRQGHYAFAQIQFTTAVISCIIYIVGIFIIILAYCS